MAPARTVTRGGCGLVAGLCLAALAGSVIGTTLTGRTAVPGVVEPGTFARYGLAAARVLLDVSTLGTVGVSLLPVLLGSGRRKQTVPVLRSALRAGMLASGGWVLGGLVSLVLQTAELRPDRMPTVGSIVDYVALFHSGQALAISTAVALVHFGLTVVMVRCGHRGLTEPRIVLSVFGLLPLPVTGHASDVGLEWGGQSLGMVSMELHVMAAASWTGGLAAVGAFVVANRSLLAVTLPRFSWLATLCLAVVGVTGVVNALLTLYESPGANPVTALFTTYYGWILFGKIGCYGVLAALGGTIRLRMLPRIASHQRVAALASWISVEATIMGLAYGLAVVLVRTPMT
ncbi:MAG: CopD family protein [Kutzneria sp.]|nr:CopD family protein [Kutzneria sp.]